MPLPDHKMHLSKDEEAILAGQKGPTLQKCLRSLVEYGEFHDADCLVPITRGHIQLSFALQLSLGSSLTIGTYLDGVYLDVVASLKSEGIKFKVPTTLNPRVNITTSWTDPYRLIEMILLARQNEFEQNFKELGGIENYSCTPYLDTPNRPNRGETLAWSESSAVIFANSHLGARTNRNSDMMDLFSAVLGVTPNFGLLLDENRKANWEVIVECDDTIDYSLLGYLIGKWVVDGVPFIRGLDGDEDNFKNMGAAMAATSAIGMYHVEGITPEAKEASNDVLKPDYKSLTITSPMLDDLRSYLARGRQKTTLVFIGCPHLSYAEVNHIARLIEGRKIRVPLWLNTTPQVIDQLRSSPIYESLEHIGAKIISACPIVFSSISFIPKWILTNSSKFCHYTPNSVYYASLEDCLRTAVGGEINEI